MKTIKVSEQAHSKLLSMKKETGRTMIHIVDSLLLKPKSKKKKGGKKHGTKNIQN